MICVFDTIEFIFTNDEFQDFQAYLLLNVNNYFILCRFLSVLLWFIGHVTICNILWRHPCKFGVHTDHFTSSDCIKCAKCLIKFCYQMSFNLADGGTIRSSLTL